MYYVTAHDKQIHGYRVCSEQSWQTSGGRLRNATNKHSDIDYVASRHDKHAGIDCLAITYDIGFAYSYPVRGAAKGGVWTIREHVAYSYPDGGAAKHPERIRISIMTGNIYVKVAMYAERKVHTSREREGDVGLVGWESVSSRLCLVPSDLSKNVFFWLK
jgi:hypothetical protein